MIVPTLREGLRPNVRAFRRFRSKLALGALELLEDRTVLAPVLAITSTNNLIAFDTATPGFIPSSTLISGLGAGETIRGIDFRPASGLLYALTSDAASVGRLYTINTGTGVATPVATLAADPADLTNPYTTLSGTEFGVDFNPVPDRLRVVSNTGQDLRINPANALVTTDADLNPGAPNVVGAAYTNSFAGATSTTLYDIDSSSDQLLIQNPPNNGTVLPVGSLGVNAADVVGFTILTTGDRAAPTNTAFASLQVGGVSGLYTINLTTGAATLSGAIGSGATPILALAAVPQDNLLVQAANAVGVDTANNLVRFNTQSPGTIASSVPITGLVGGDTIVGIDFRPATGVLYGVGSGARLYTIDTTTAAATLVTALAADPTDATSPFTTLSGTEFGVDFNPVADRLRVVSTTGQDLRINPANGLVTTDTDLNPGTPNVVGAAYTNSFVGATSTTLFDIDSTTDQLFIQNPPNNGTLTLVGALGVNASDVLEFDIRPGLNTAFATLVVGGTPGLYSIDLTTGAATLIGAIGGGTTLRGFSLVPNGTFRFTSPTYLVNESGQGFVVVQVERVGGSDGVVSTRFSTADGSATAPGDYAAQNINLVFLDGAVGPSTLTIPIVNDASVEGPETFTVNLSGASGGVVLGPGATATVTINEIDVPSVRAFGVTPTNNLVQFNTQTPNVIVSSTPITGLVGGDNIVGIDFRPATGVLYGVGSGGRLYTIDTTTAAATVVATLAADPADLTNPFTTLSGTEFGVDFNPVPDRLRVVSNTGQDLRINPANGLVTTDADLNPGTPNVVGAAYTNSFAGATATTLYDIDSTTDELLIQNPPNNGTLTTVGPLGINATDVLGFDIRNGESFGMATLVVGGIPGLYLIDLASGAATFQGILSGPTTLRGFSIAPSGALRFSAPTFSVNEGGVGFITVQVERVGGTEGAVSATLTTADGTATSPGDYAPQNVVVTFLDGATGPLSINIPIVNDGLVEANESFTVTLSGPTGGVALGTPSTATVTITDDDGPGINAFGVDASGNLVRFRVNSPGTIVSSTPITGLVAGDAIVGLDFRPVNGLLYGLGSTGRLYTINQATGAATAVGAGPLTPALSGTAFGFDFNPVVDRIRVTSDADQNLRLDPSTGAVVDSDPGTPGVQPDQNLAYAAADPNAGQNPNVVGAAYTSNGAFPTTTTLYGIDSNLDILVIQNPPNNGTLNTVGPLGVDASAVLGFDIVNLGGVNSGLASLVVGGVPGLYAIDLTTGAATLIGAIGGGTTLQALAIAPPGISAAVTGTTATFTGTDAAESLVIDAAGGLLRHNRFDAGDAGYNSPFDFDSTTPGDQTLSASDPAVSIIFNAGNNDDSMTVGSPTTPAGALAASFVFNGEGGNDQAVLDDSADATGRTVVIGPGTVTGLGGPFSHTGVESLIVNGGTGADTVNVLGTAAATSLNTGGGDDTVAFGNGATLSGGFLDGGPGTNALDYSAYTTAVTVDLSPAQAQTLFAGRLSGVQEPGPRSSSQATGTGVFTLNAAQTQLAFSVAYQDLEGAPISGAHFHNAPFGVNGPIVRGVAGTELNGSVVPSGVLSGIWSSSDASALTPALVTELLAGRIYFNIHTLPNFPSGEIRGQLVPMGTVHPATGTSGVRGFDNVTGGSAADSITGNANVNVLHGGGDNDTIVGGQGGDQVFGDGGDDLLVWNNGDGSDFMEGGAGNDTVQVNGSPAGSDQFLIQVNPGDPTRLRFDRTNLGLFNLNIGTTEALDFNTLGGDDTTTVDFAGGNPIPVNGIDFDGGAGADRLVLQRSAGSFSAASEIYTATSGGAGTISVDGAVIAFSGLEPVTDTMPAASFTFNAPAGPQAIVIVNGPPVGSTPTTRIASAASPPAFEQIDFANKTSVTVNGSADDDVITLDNPTPAAGLTTLQVNAGNGNDTVNVVGSGLPPGVAVTLDGGLGADTLNFDATGGTVVVTPTTITFNGHTLNYANFQNVNIQNASGAPVVPVSPPSTINGVEGQGLVDVVAARFNDADLGAKASDYLATIDWGDGTTSAGVITQDASTPSLFFVTGSHTYLNDGNFTVTTTIRDTGGTSVTTAGGVTTTITFAPEPPVPTTTPAAIKDAPVFAQGAGVAATEDSSFTGLVATFSTSDPNATAADFTAPVINWGDGSPTSTGTITAVGMAPGGFPTFQVIGTHTFDREGTFTVKTTITSLGGSAAVAPGTANVADVALNLAGRLDRASDSGLSNVDGITNVRAPRFVGASSPGAVIQIFATRTDARLVGPAVLVGSGVADSSGVFRITTRALADGVYRITGKASETTGATTASALFGTVVIDTVGPRVSGLTFTRVFGRMVAGFVDDRGGLDRRSLLNAANFIVTGPSPRTARLPVTSIGLSTPSGPRAPVNATVTLNGGRALTPGKYTIRIVSGGVRDLAGNALDGEFTARFPSGNGRPGGDFLARVTAFHNFNSAPQPVLVPVVPAGATALFARRRR